MKIRKTTATLKIILLFILFICIFSFLNIIQAQTVTEKIKELRSAEMERDRQEESTQNEVMGELDGFDAGVRYAKYVGLEEEPYFDGQKSEYFLMEKSNESYWVGTQADMGIGRGSVDLTPKSSNTRPLYEDDDLIIIVHIRGDESDSCGNYGETIEFNKDWTRTTNCTLKDFDVRTNDNKIHEANVRIKVQLKQGTEAKIHFQGKGGNTGVLSFDIQIKGTIKSKDELIEKHNQARIQREQEQQAETQRKIEEALNRTLGNIRFEANYFYNNVSVKMQKILELKYPRKDKDDSTEEPTYENTNYLSLPADVLQSSDWRSFSVTDRNGEELSINVFMYAKKFKAYCIKNQGLYTLRKDEEGNITKTFITLNHGHYYNFDYVALWSPAFGERGHHPGGKIIYMHYITDLGTPDVPIEDPNGDESEFEDLVGDITDVIQTTADEEYEQYYFWLEYEDSSEDRGRIHFDDVFEHIENYIPTEEGSDTRVVNRVSVVLTIITNIGMIVAILMLAVIGVKYMLGSVEDKAEYKKDLIPYLVGAILLFGITTFVKILQLFGQNINNL